MSIGLLISIGALGLATWLAAMHALWRSEQAQRERPLTMGMLVWLSEKVLRLTRRAWYRLESYGIAAAGWMNKRFAALFFKLFPNAKPAFAKKDELAGLSTGPSSRFLRSISKEEK